MRLVNKDFLSVIPVRGRQSSQKVLNFQMVLGNIKMVLIVEFELELKT